MLNPTRGVLLFITAVVCTCVPNIFVSRYVYKHPSLVLPLPYTLQTRATSNLETRTKHGGQNQTSRTATTRNTFTGTTEHGSSKVSPISSTTNPTDLAANGTSNNDTTPAQAKTTDNNIQKTMAPPNCTNLGGKLTFNLTTNTSPRWQVVTENVTFVYSAFTDPRPNDTQLIRMIAVSRDHQRKEQYECQVWLPGSQDAYTFPAKFEPMIDRWSAVYRSYFVVCRLPLKSPITLVEDTRVSVATRGCGVPSNMLLLQINTPRETFDYKFHSCLGGSLKHGIDSIGQLIQWMEVQSVFGSQHFAVYESDVGDSLRKYMDPFIERGILDKHQWNLLDYLKPINRDVIWSFGQLALINDCLYRYMYKSEYLVFNDLDELIVPRCEGCMNWSDMLERISKEQACQGRPHFSFRSAFFTDRQKRNLDEDERYAWKSLNNIQRKGEWMPYSTRTKYIVNPRQVTEEGVHLIRESYPAGIPWMRSLCPVKPDIGGVHHFKLNFIGRRITTDLVIDNATHAFKDLIMAQVSSALNGKSMLLNPDNSNTPDS